MSGVEKYLQRAAGYADILEKVNKIIEDKCLKNGRVHSRMITRFWGNDVFTSYELGLECGTRMRDWNARVHN